MEIELKHKGMNLLNLLSKFMRVHTVNFKILKRNTKDNKILVNNVDEKTNKLEWKELTHRKTWSISTL